MDVKKLVIEGKQYNDIEIEYIVDRLSVDSRMTVYDMNGERVEECRVFICHIGCDGRIYVKKLDEEGRPTGPECEVKSGYYISGCEYAQLEI